MKRALANLIINKIVCNLAFFFSLQFSLGSFVAVWKSGRLFRWFWCDSIQWQWGRRTYVWKKVINVSMFICISRINHFKAFYGWKYDKIIPFFLFLRVAFRIIFQYLEGKWALASHSYHLDLRLQPYLEILAWLVCFKLQWVGFF